MEQQRPVDAKKTDPKCHNCNEIGHMARYCKKENPHNGHKCTNCGKLNHHVSKCKKRAQPAATTAQPQPQPESTNLIEEKTPKNRLTETLEPQKQKTGAQTLSVAIKPIFSLLYSPTGCSQLALDAVTNGTIHITLLLQVSIAKNFCTLHRMLTVLYTNTLESRELCL